MNKASTKVVASGFLIAGALALGACSSGVDQGQSADEASREAAPTHASPTGEAPTGKPPQKPVTVPKGNVVVPQNAAPKSGSGKSYFGDVTVSATKGVSCKQETHADELVVTCPKLSAVNETFHEQVNVYLPDKTYKVTVENTGHYNTINSWLNDYLDMPYKNQMINNTGSWSGKDIWTGGWGWNVSAAPAGDNHVEVKLTVTRQFD